MGSKAVAPSTPLWKSVMDSLNSQSLFDIKAKVAVVTGGATGIGFMIARYVSCLLPQSSPPLLPVPHSIIT